MKIRAFSPATWMADLADQIGQKSLAQLAWPGTHDSGTYGITERSEVSPDEPSWMKDLPVWIRRIIAGWAKTQGLDFAGQLDAGIRYFDLRLCAKPGDALFLCHGLYSVPVSDLLSQVSSFLEAHPREVVILDFNHFYGMSQADSQAFGAALASTFGGKLVPPSAGIGVKLSQIWQAGQQVIVFYEPPQSVPGASRFWSQDRIQSNWPNVQTLPALQAYLQGQINGKPADKLWVLQGILTENTSVVLAGLTKPPETMEQWASTTTPAVVSWVESRWQNAGLNIVIVDWFNLAGYVETVISLNLSRRFDSEELHSPWGTSCSPEERAESSGE